MYRNVPAHEEDNPGQRIYTGISESHTLKMFIQQLCSQAILCYPPPLQGFKYRRSYKLTHSCVTYLQ